MVDGNELANQFIENYSIIPFIENNGVYWGEPEDDDTAIIELNRLQREGAGFLVFWWTAFWWFTHYSKFHSYLRSTFECAFKNEAIVVFDLNKKATSQINYGSEKLVSV